MLTLFAAAPLVPYQIPDLDGEVLETLDAPACPPGWSCHPEGNTGWWTLYGPVPSNAPKQSPKSKYNRVMMFDMSKAGLGRVSGGQLGLFIVQVQSRYVLEILRPMLGMVPWWSTVSEIRDPGAAMTTGIRDGAWGVITDELRLMWSDLGLLPEDDTPAYLPFVSMSGANATEEAEATDAQDVLTGPAEDPV